MLFKSKSVLKFLAFACILSGPLFAQEIPAGNPVVETGAWSKDLGKHPILYGSKERLKALAKENPRVYGEIRNASALEFRCITQAVEGLDKRIIDKTIAETMNTVNKGPSNKHQDTWIELTNAAFVYDFFYNELGDSNRKKIIEWMNATYDFYRDDENAFHNSTMSKILTYLRIAYATWNDNPKAKTFRDKALLDLYESKLIPVLNKYGAGGGWTECGWYQRHSVWHLTQALELARLAEGYDGFKKCPKFFYQRLAYELLQPYPGFADYGAENYAMEGDGANIYSAAREYPRHMRNVIARYFVGSELSEYTAGKNRTGSNLLSRAFDFLYGGPADAPKGLAGYPLAHIAKDIGKVYARDSWDDDAAWFRFECSDYWNQHQHLEAGNFEIFCKEQLATESGEYITWSSPHAVNWLTRTIAHNCMLVNMPGEEWKNYRSVKELENDGGQAKKWESVVGTLPEWEAKQGTFSRGRITAYENTAGFMYLTGDCTKAYNSRKVNKYIRRVVFLRPGVFVIYDRIAAMSKDYAKTWLLHCRNEPEISNAEFTVKNGAGTLNCYALLPEKTVISKVEGYTYGGKNYPEKESKLTPEADLWRVEIKPGIESAENIFLNVLSTAGKKKPVLIQKGKGVGVSLDGSEVVFEGDTGGYILVNGVKSEMKGEVVAGKYER